MYSPVPVYVLWPALAVLVVVSVARLAWQWSRPVSGPSGLVLDAEDSAHTLHWHVDTQPCCATVTGMARCATRRRLTAQARSDARRAVKGRRIARRVAARRGAS